MNRDRGVIKWTSLMLPEHVQQLKELAEKKKRKIAPSIDPQLYEEWNQLLTKAYHDKETIVVTILKDGIEEELQGLIHRIDPLNHCLILTDDERLAKTTIPFQAITNVRLN